MFKFHSLPALVLLLIATTLHSASAQDKSVEKSKASDAAGSSGKADRSKLVTRDQIEEALEHPCPNLQFSGESPLSEFLEVFEAHWARDLPYPVQILPDATELDLEGIASLEDVLVRDFRLAGGTHTCRDALELVFSRTTDPQVTFQVRRGHLLVTTLAKAESEDALETRLYDLTGLLLQPLSATRSATTDKSDADDAAAEVGKRKGKGRRKNKKASADTTAVDADEPKTLLTQFGGGGLGQFAQGSVGSGMTQVSSTSDSGIDSLITLIQQQTSPPAKWFEVDGEGGQISVHGQYLMIRQTYQMHRQIEQMIDELKEAIKVSGPPRYFSTRRQGFSGGGGSFGSPTGGGGAMGGMGGGGGGFGGGLGGGGMGGQQGGGGGFFSVEE